MAQAKQALAAVQDTRMKIRELAELAGLETSASLMGDVADFDTDASFHQIVNDFERESERLGAMLREWPAIAEALRNYRQRLGHENLDLQKAVLSEANVVGATCSSIAGAKEFDSDFDCVIVDEAGRTTPLDLLMPIVRGKSIIIVGDHKQLPPFMGDELRKEIDLAHDENLERPIFQTIYENSHPQRRQRLSKQYRMVPSICDIVQEISYADQGTLQTAGDALTRKHPFPDMHPVHWVVPTGASNMPMQVGKGGLINTAEVNAAMKMLERIADTCRVSAVKRYSVGVISMYKHQSQAIERALDKDPSRFTHIDVEIGTVDAFQGREMDAIILTFSETDPTRRRFFYETSRLNVALSRGRELLVIIGSIDKLGKRPQAFGKANPIFELRSLLDLAHGVSTSKEVFHA